MAEIRLDKFLANRSSYSRNEVKNLLRKGAVRVDAVTECDGSRKIDPDSQIVTCLGKQIQSGSHVYLILNKPVGYLCATEDRSHRTVLDLIPESLRIKGLFPAGRLDLDSTGLVLLTDDGQLAHEMLAPKKHVPKYYLVRLRDPIRDQDIQALSKGIVLSDQTHCLPAQAQAFPDSYVLICLHEGKYHQVKRMFASLGNHVESLHRVAIGGLILPENLRSGAYLEILHKDLAVMLKAQSFQVICEQILKNFSSYSINASP
ncbi:MAG: 16S rRNA pseudouridine(516) synthase [Oscillospiraceae bacterium]|nr:16S rRNA pseudouridine(516) synthase [Oscillospiraceae bacterium]